MIRRFHGICYNLPNTFSNLSLVISGIYDVHKRIPEYHKYFENLQSNVQLEEGSPQSCQ